MNLSHGHTHTHRHTRTSSIHIHAQQWVWITITCFTNVTCAQHKYMNIVWLDSKLDLLRIKIHYLEQVGKWEWPLQLSISVCVYVCVWWERQSPESNVWQTAILLRPVLRHTSAGDVLKTCISPKTDNYSPVQNSLSRARSTGSPKLLSGYSMTTSYCIL